MGNSGANVGGLFLAGEAYLYSGATGALRFLIPNPAPTITGRFGLEVDGVPDLDGDGRGDLLVGTYYPQNRTYVFSGATGALMYTFPFSGEAVAWVPDTNGDGVADLLTTYYAFGPGTVRLYSGATGTLIRSHTSPNQPSGGNGFGLYLAGVDDVNGDGRGDYLIGASGEIGIAGRAYLYSGGTGALLRTMTSPNVEARGRFGAGVAGVPDVDGDGRMDHLVGAYTELGDGSGNGPGRAYLFSGATGALLQTLYSLNPARSGGFGRALAGVEDVDGDGRGDLVIGAYQERSGTASEAGTVYLFSGADGMPIQKINSPDPGYQGFFGFGVDSAQDLDGDGYRDVIVNESGEGRTYVFSSAAPLVLELTPQNPPVVIPPGGGPLRFTASLTNTADAPLSFEAWIEATLPDGQSQRVTPVRPLTLPANSTVSQTLTLQVPASASPGPYVLTLKAGTYGVEVIALRSFPFVKQPGAGPTPAVQFPGAFTVFGDEGSEGPLFTKAMPTAAEPNPDGLAYALDAAPNPVRDRALLGFTLPEPGPVRLVLHDALGREVAVIAEGTRSAGSHEAVLDASRLAPGVYVARLRAGEAVVARRLVVAR